MTATSKPVKYVYLLHGWLPEDFRIERAVLLGESKQFLRWRCHGQDYKLARSRLRYSFDREHLAAVARAELAARRHRLLSLVELLNENPDAPYHEPNIEGFTGPIRLE